MTLTEKRVAQLKEPDRYADGNCSGLYLQVMERDRSFVALPLRPKRAG
jgi:hypothetical protein